MTLNDQIRLESAKHYIEKFELYFDDYVDQLAGIVVMNGQEAVRPEVQALVNAYHDSGREIGPVEIKKFNTLMMFIKVSGATKERSSDNESLNILNAARPSI